MMSSSKDHEISTSRNFKCINDQNFVSDLPEKLSQLHNTDNLQTLCEEFIKAITSTLNQHAPEITRKRTKRQPKSWYDRDTQKLKRKQRITEEIWPKTKRNSDNENYLHIEFT